VKPTENSHREVSPRDVIGSRSRKRSGEAEAIEKEGRSPDFCIRTLRAPEKDEIDYQEREKGRPITNIRTFTTKRNLKKRRGKMVGRKKMRRKDLGKASDKKLGQLKERTRRGHC